MEQKRNSSRTNLSFLVSMILHSTAILLIALGPSFMPGLSGGGDKSADSVEFTVSNNTPADIQPVVVPPSPEVQMPAKLPEPAQVAEVIKPQPVKKVAAQKATPKKAPVSDKLPEKAAIEPQPIMEASNTETPVDQQETVEESPVMTPVQERVEAQPAEEEIIAEEEVLAKEEPVQQQVAKEEPIKAEPTPIPVAAAAPVAEKAVETQAAQGQAQDTVKSQSAAGQEVIQVTQNYMGLRQQAGNVPPKYSRDMRLKQMQGRGQLVYFVSKEGRVSDVRVMRSTGSAELDQSAIQAFSKYKFVPGQEGYTLHDFEFSLKGPAESDAGRLRTTLNR